MSSIQTIITDGKSGKQIDLPKTTFTIDSDKQKKTLKKTKKTKATTCHRHDAQYKAKPQTSNTQTKNIQQKHTVQI